MYAAYSALCVPALRIELMGTQSHLFARKKREKNGHDAFSACWCLSNEDDEKLGDTKWAGTHLSSQMKSTAPPRPMSHLDKADQISTEQTKSRQGRPNLDKADQISIKKSKDRMLSN